jgi:hypothetical protein
MEWNPLGLEVTAAAPELTFRYPIVWKAEKLLRDSSGKSYAVATPIDPVRQQELLISGDSGSVVPFRRVFVAEQNGWKMVEDKSLTHTALRLTEHGTN